MADTKCALRVVLCRAYVDNPIVQELYYQLAWEEIDAWLDTKKLVPGHDRGI